MAALCALIALSITRLHCIGIKLLIIVLPMLFVLLKVVWVRLTAPEGERVQHADAPELFVLLDDMSVD